MTPQEVDTLYQKRLTNLQTGHIADNYDPMEPVAGASRPEPLDIATPAERDISTTALDEARDYAKSNNSAAFLVWRDGKLQDASYFGQTTPATELASLSLAKPLATIAIGRAINLHKIRSLDQPVADFITEWRGTPKDKILIRHVLQMTSGLLQQGVSPDPASPLNLAYLHPFHDHSLIHDYPLTDPPGARYAYSNADAELVALIIERATGLRYADFVAQQVLSPLGAAGGRVWIDRPGGLAHSGCCILLPAETWLKLGILILNGGTWNGKTLLSPDFVTAMLAPNPRYAHTATMGIYVAGSYIPRRGFSGPGQPGPEVLHGEPYLAADLVLFDGNADQVIYIVPSAKLVALRMGGPPPKAPEWDNSKIPNILLRGIDWHGSPPPSQ